MKFEKVLKGTLGDWKHWAGWILSAIGITWFLSLIFALPSTFFNTFAIIFIAEVFIDVIKHLVKLQ